MAQYYSAQAEGITFVIEPEPGSGGLLLLKFGSDGFVGDTWHSNVEEAKAQASHDTGKIVGPWKEIDKDFKEELIRSLRKN